MSVTKILAGRASISFRATTPRILLTNAATRNFPRAFSTTTPEQRTVTESVKDSLKKADRAVSDKIVGGIDIGGIVFPLSHAFPSFNIRRSSSLL
jgi:hypothetical protein